MFSFYNTKIWLYRNPIDFRKQIDGLVIFIAGHFDLDPTCGELFVFRNQKSDKIKVLFWDRNGFWLLYKRLEKGRFKFPVIKDEQQELSRDEMNWLLTGLDFTKHQSLPKTAASKFY